jgi:hypothetical protein
MAECVSPATTGSIIPHQMEHLAEQVRILTAENKELKNLLREVEWNERGQTCFWCGGDFMKHCDGCKIEQVLRKG